MNVQKDKFIPAKTIKQKITKNVKQKEEVSEFYRLQDFNMNSTGDCTQVEEATMNIVPSTGSPQCKYVTFILICSIFRALTL